MAVHQVREYFVHITEDKLSNKDNVEKARQYVENEGYEFIHEDDLTIEVFTCDREAEELETKVLEILNS